MKATSNEGSRRSKPEGPARPGQKASASWWKPVVLLAAVCAVFVAARLLGVGEKLADLRHWMESLGVWGPVVFVLLYAVAVVLALPGSALTVASGALFGSIEGVALVSVAATLGASLSFLIARYVARDAVVAWLSKNQKFQQLDRLTRERGAVIVALTRLVPLFPFNLLNYGFGLTSVPFRTYLFWSWLCMLPGTALYVMGGDVLARGLRKGGIPRILISTIAVAGILVVLLVRLARKKLKENESKAEAD
ncbi:MAG: TVP38/TMEM64 family protein [Acidobacteria bacterium]|nr:TVP38/TMEM64 family protein [Acidobacteriota bacterium]MCI0720314.1 TVP38/TMEM64 family protein [Acidobacteriota bacterium]